MKKILYLVLVAVLTVTAVTAWGQHTLGNIPDGWTVKVGETPVTVTNGTATIAAGATVVLTYTGPKYVNSIDLSRKSANDINLTNANKATAVSSFNSTTDSRLLFTEDISGSLTFTSSDGETDMNGHTNNSSDDCYIQNNVEGKSITFKNGTVSASFDGAPSWNDFYKGTVILENMTVNGSIFTDGHAYIINGGTYNKIRHYKKTGTPGTVTIYDGKFSVFNDTEADNAAQSLGGADCKGGAYILYGGKYKFNPSTTTLGREATITIPDGYSVQSNTDDDSGTYPWVVKSNSGIPANMYNLVGSQGNTVWTFTMPNYNVEMETNWVLHALGDIPTGWNVTADNVNFTASETNHEAHIPAGSTVTLTPLYPAKVKSVKLKDVPPTGAINGLFSVSSTKQVWFSQGNLQYTKSTGVWSFMEHQYSTVETNGSPYCTDNYGTKDVVSLFSWATSGYNHGATSYQPYSTNTTNENYYAYGAASYNLYDQTGQADWGYNAISNGGNTVNSDWRTLTTVEWQYLFANHTTGWSSVNGVNGYVIRPDGVSTAIAASYTASDWDTEEAAGAVFLPAAGYRNSYEGTDVYDKGSIGRYWSSSADGSNANYVNFSNSSLGPNYTMNRKYGLSVRLVKNAN